MVSIGSTVNFDGYGAYFPMYTGVSTVTITMRGGGGKAHLTTESKYTTRYYSVDIPEGRPVVLSNIARAEGTSRYLNIAADNDATEVGVTIINYSL